MISIKLLSKDGKFIDSWNLEDTKSIMFEPALGGILKFRDNEGTVVTFGISTGIFIIEEEKNKTELVYRN